MHAGLDPAAEEALGAEGSGQDPGWADYGLGQATVMDGVRLIAGGIEIVLQRLQLQVGLDAKRGLVRAISSGKYMVLLLHVRTCRAVRPVDCLVSC